MPIATLVVALVIASCAASVAWAAPDEVNVRIEGAGETLFEGPVLTEGHEVRASSDSAARSCDGINVNDPENLIPSPTPTAASADAMSIVGETFDGRWYPGFEDYFITRWGPDAEAEGESWGVLVNNVFTDVGGCQYELNTGDEVLWVYGAFAQRPFLALYPAGDTAGARPLTAQAELGKPFDVEVLDYSDDAEDAPPPAPERTGSAPFEGAKVTPVLTSPKGFEQLQREDPATVSTDAQGKASIVFTQPGWHRIKASAVNGEGAEDAIRSNRLDVCVPAEGASGCGAPPSEDEARAVVRAEDEDGPPAGEHAGSGPDEGTSPVSVAQGTGTAGGGAAGTQAPRVNGRGAPRGSFGRVLVLRDDRAPGLHYRGRWRRVALAGAWRGTVTRAGPGAEVEVTLGPGRPVFQLRGTAHRAEVEVLEGKRHEIFAVAGGAAGSPRLVRAMKRARRGAVRLRVLKGTVDLDGVAVEP